MNIFKLDYGHMFWYIRTYMWKRQFYKLNETLNYDEEPFRYLLALLCMVGICSFFSIVFAFEYIILGKAHGVYWHEYIKYCYEKKAKLSRENHIVHNIFTILFVFTLAFYIRSCNNATSSVNDVKKLNTPVNNYQKPNESNEQDIDRTDFEPYMRDLQKRVKINWDPPKDSISRKTTLDLKISKKGQLLSMRINKSSGLKSFDEAALRAVETTAPFKPLPENFKGKSIDILFTLELKVNQARY